MRKKKELKGAESGKATSISITPEVAEKLDDRRLPRESRSSRLHYDIVAYWELLDSGLRVARLSFAPEEIELIAAGCSGSYYGESGIRHPPADIIKERVAQYVRYAATVEDMGKELNIDERILLEKIKMSSKVTLMGLLDWLVDLAVRLPKMDDRKNEIYLKFKGNKG